MQWGFSILLNALSLASVFGCIRHLWKHLAFKCRRNFIDLFHKVDIPLFKSRYGLIIDKLDLFGHNSCTCWGAFEEDPDEWPGLVNDFLFSWFCKAWGVTLIASLLTEAWLFLDPRLCISWGVGILGRQISCCWFWREFMFFFLFWCPGSIPPVWSCEILLDFWLCKWPS